MVEDVGMGVEVVVVVAEDPWAVAVVDPVVVVDPVAVVGPVAMADHPGFDVGADALPPPPAELGSSGDQSERQKCRRQVLVLGGPLFPICRPARRRIYRSYRILYYRLRRN